MQHHDWQQLREEALSSVIGRKMIHSQTMTVARIQLRKGAVVPSHHHANEQISMVESGALRFVVGEEERILRAGEVLVIPPHVAHAVEALEDSIAVDLFSPPREDWIRGDDAYLRQAGSR